MSSFLHPTQTSFMQSPLMTWLKTLLDEENCNDYGELCKGIHLNKVWLQIDPNPSYCDFATSTDTIPVSTSNTTTNTTALSSLTTDITNCSNSIKNLNILLNNIKNFYENVLDQILVLKLPDITSIALNSNEELLMSTVLSNNPPPYHGLFSFYSSNSPNNLCNCDDMQTLLLLILGCAVQCENKELFIEKIKQMDISTQHLIVECIQQITDNPESVFLVSEWTTPPSNVAEKDRLYSVFVNQINRLTKERDQLYQRVVDLSCDLLNLTVQTASIPENTNNLSLSNSSLNINNNFHQINNHCDQKSHYLVELADVKSKLRRVQQDLEEKNEIVSELKEVIEQNKEFCNKLRHDNLELTQEARTAKAYRDEIDVLNERVRKIDRLEAEVQRYRDKMNELDYCKTRVEELREDNRILGETKTMLEEQLETSRKRGEKIPELEEKILKLNAHGNELNLQRELDKNQIERLIDEISHLRIEKKHSNEELSRVTLELTDLRAQMRLAAETTLMKSEEGNLFDQMNQDTSKRLLKFEHENKKLQSLIEDYQNNYVDVDSIISLFINIDNFGFNKNSTSGSSDNSENGYDSNKSKIEKLNLLKEFIGKININCVNVKALENEKIVLEKEIGELKQKLDDVSSKFEATERNLVQVGLENQKFNRIIEKKSKKLEEYKSELEAIEMENQKLVSNADSLRLSLKKLNNLEIEMTNLEAEKQCFEQENKSLEKEISRLKTSIDYKDKIIDENSAKIAGYEIEVKHLRKEIEINGQLVQRLKETEKESKDSLNALAVQKNTLAALQKDLVEEKLKTQKFSDELAKIIETMNKLSSENGSTKHYSMDNHSLNNAASIVNDFVQTLNEKYSQQKDSHIEELQTRLTELKENNQEMQTLINSLKRQLNIDENSDLKSSLDSLNEMQKKIYTLEDENLNLKTELNTHKENQAIKNSLINECNSELKNKNATLEVENSLLKSQNSSLETQTVQLQEQMVLIQESIEKLKIKCEEYETGHRLLMADNESLQEIHQQLTADYENLTENHGILKQSYKKLKMDYKSLENELDLQFKKYEELMNNAEEELKTLKDENEKMGSKTELTADSEEKLLSITTEYKNLTDEHKRLQTEHKMLQNIYKKLRSDNNDLKLKHTELQGETAECKDRMNALNVEVSKLSNYCEMVAMTNNTLETQRKKLATQSGSLLTQYNDLLIELSCGCERSVKDKLHELFLKKERLEKMFKDYDISFEKNMPRVSNNNNNNSQHSLDDSIYGLLWESETPNISGGSSGNNLDSKFYNSTALLRQYSLNNTELEKRSPPRIPPRSLIQRQTINLSPINNSKETSIEFTPSNFPMENKMLINISSRNSQLGNAGKSSDNAHSTIIDGTISKLHITTGPFITKSLSPATAAKTNSNNNNNSYFMRGSFKSNSINYGNLTRKGVISSGGGGGMLEQPIINTKIIQHGSTINTKWVSNRVQRLNNATSSTTTTQRNFNPVSPSFNSDSSSSSHTGGVCEESEVDMISSINNNNCTAISATNNNNGATRSRITFISDSIQTNGFNNKDNISIQISNALNNNTIGEKEPTGTTCSGSNSITNDNNQPTATPNSSNSIWYEYGCV